MWAAACLVLRVVRAAVACDAACWRPLAALVLALAGLVGAAPAVRAAEFTQFQLERSGDSLLLSAQVRLELPPVVYEALQKGIPMFFVAEASILRDRWYWYDKEVVSATRYLRLSYQPLTRRWRLLVSATPVGQAGLALGQGFDSREEALAAIQRVSGWKIADAGDVEIDARHTLSLRFRLDTSQLPRPFQIGAVGQGEWNVSAVRTQRLSAEMVR